MRALAIGARSYRNVASILEHGLDQLPLPGAPTDAASLSVGVHENVRGPDYYH
jgi:hypothetical protein